MTAPATGDNNNPTSESTNPATSGASAGVGLRRDLIPVFLLIGVFAIVMFITWFTLKDNWTEDMTRYRSLKAQQNGEWATAVDELNKLVENGKEADDPLIYNSPTYLAELGYSYLGLKKYEKALDYYKRAQENRSNVPPDDQGNPRPLVDFHNMIGLTYFKMGDLAEAEKALQAALAFSKLDPLANFTYGELEMKRGNYIKAADYFKVVANNPSYEKNVKAYYAEIEKKLFAGIE